MQWRRPVSLHWRVEQSELSARLPRGVTLDLYRGEAYLSLVALRVAGPAPRAALASPLVQYQQINLRTYGTRNGRSGIVLLESQVNRRVALSARLLGMPYRYVRDVSVRVGSADVWVRGKGLELDGTMASAETFTPTSGTLDHFLTEREWVFSEVFGAAYAMRISHPSWQLRPLRLAPIAGPHRGVPADPPERAYVGSDLDVAIVEVARFAPEIVFEGVPDVAS
jgi:uncharacterized protein YqjF (DUF2071 family)